ncbi:TRAP transporter large permease [Desulfosarcina ovata]|uniref:ABC transporter permease n=2 Tax=Desulfosarcina ovata TaxID=83564 RepID=A0A5K8AHK6_9BACT|nr:TRAP transporter large permease [Desulfosarcina ovata]BBO85229.1 ABC transporter permease [Desulfosarcina ovata subsp. sediminis]BBO92121.1 ABC transporter permease [Desulfosarcina ovata subsp. ovata]
MSIEWVLLVFFALLLAGVPMAFTMIAVSSLYFALSPVPGFIFLIPEKIFEALDYIVMTAIPFFLLAGDLMNRSGMAEQLMSFSNLVIGGVRSGLAQVNVMASLLFSGLTGVAVGDIAALGKVEVTMMEKSGYPRAFAAAVTIASSLIGPIIPPSGIIILYAAVMDVSIGGMFLAALFPGLLMALADMLIIALQAKPRNFPKSDVARALPDLARGLKVAFLAIMMPFILIGGIVSGLMTPTEAAAVSVLYALFVGGVLYRALTLRKIIRIFANSTYESARLLFLLAGAMTMSWIFALENLSEMAQAFFAGLNASPIVIIFLINMMFIVFGTIMEPCIALILFAPIVGPVAYSIGVTPYQLGIMLIMNVTVGLATPPVGAVLFAMASIVNVKITSLIREMLPFLAIKFVLLLIIGLVPPLTTFIPRLFGL